MQNSMQYILSEFQKKELIYVIEDIYNDTKIIQSEAALKSSTITAGGFIGTFIRSIMGKTVGSEEIIYKEKQEIINQFYPVPLIEESEGNISDRIGQLDSFSELKRLYEEVFQRDLGVTVWDNLNERSRAFLITAQIIFESLIAFEINLDFSAPILSFCKVVENELNEKVLLPFKDHALQNRQTFKVILSDLYSKKHGLYTSKLAYILDDINFKQHTRLMLGDHLYIFKRIVNGEHLDEIEKKYKEFIPIDNITNWSKLNYTINEIKTYYRNPSAHDSGLLKLEQCNKCRELVVERGFIKDLFRLINISK